MATNTYDIVGFAHNLELDYADISDLYVSYIDEISMHCERLRAAFLKNDFMELEGAVHTIKGLSGNLWIEDVFQEASAFDSLLKDNACGNTEEYLNRLLDLIVNSRDKIFRSFAEVNIIL